MKKLKIETRINVLIEYFISVLLLVSETIRITAITGIKFRNPKNVFSGVREIGSQGGEASITS